jgi:MFS transporter, CP family, cyanate transporter
VTGDDRRWRLTGRSLLGGVAVVLLAVNLRPGASSIGPVLAELQEGLAMPPAVTGLLTALPALAFAVFGALAISLALRSGLNAAILVGAVAAAVGLLLRVVVDHVAVFMLLTLLAFAGMAIGNVLVPAFIKRHFPRRLAGMTAAYTTGLAIGASVPAALSAPLAQELPGGWRASLGLWGLTAALAVVPWTVLAVLEHRRRVRSQRAITWSMFAVARSRTALALTLFFGSQSTQAYVQFGWIAQIYRDGGLEAPTAGLMASVIAAFGIPTGLLMPWAVSRFRDLRPLVVALGVLLAAGYAGVLLAPTTAPWAWAMCLGASGAAFPLAIALVTIRTRDPRVTTRVSAFTQSGGYLLAASGPFVVGALLGLSGGWTVPLLVLIASSGVMIGAGVVAAAPGYVDDEIPLALRS